MYVCAYLLNDCIEYDNLCVQVLYRKLENTVENRA